MGSYPGKTIITLRLISPQMSGSLYVLSNARQMGSPGNRHALETMSKWFLVKSNTGLSLYNWLVKNDKRMVLLAVVKSVIFVCPSRPNWHGLTHLRYIHVGQEGQDKFGNADYARSIHEHSDCKMSSKDSYMTFQFPWDSFFDCLMDFQLLCKLR